jgi:pseudouridine kinase
MGVNPAQVIVVGAASMDIKGRPQKALVPGTSNPGSIRISVGGVGRNIAESLARLGVRTTLLSAVGDDEWGQRILECTAAGGVDVSQVLINAEHHSAAYLAILDEAGEKSISIDDMDIMESVTPKYIYAHRRWIKEADMVVMDANLSPKAVRSLISIAKKHDVPVCADPTSAILAQRLIEHLPGLYMITPDASEAKALCEAKLTGRSEAIRAAKRLIAMGVDIAIITLAEKGLCYATSEVGGYIPAIRSEIVDRTGAGDALTAGVVFGLLNDFPIDEAVRLGVSAATLTLQCKETVCSDLSLERLYDQLVI